MPSSDPSGGFVVFVSYRQQLFNFNHKLMDLIRRKLLLDIEERSTV
jgi:hypothetical protein